MRGTVPVRGIDHQHYNMLVRQSGNVSSLIVFTEYALNNPNIRNVSNGKWTINMTHLIDHLNRHLSLSPLDVDLGYDMDLAQFITDIHWSMAHYQSTLLQTKLKTEVAIKQLFYDIQTETLYLMCDFISIPDRV